MIKKLYFKFLRAIQPDKHKKEETQAQLDDKFYCGTYYPKKTDETSLRVSQCSNCFSYLFPDTLMQKHSFTSLMEGLLKG